MVKKPPHLTFGATRARLEHERFESLINSMADGVITTDQKGKVNLYNGAALGILDRNLSMNGTYVGTVLKLLDKKNQPIDTNALVLETKTQSISRDYRIAYDDGSFINLYLSITPVRHGYGRGGQGGFVLLFRDITREKSLEEERDEFISVVSHELRTPVAIAEGNLSNASLVIDKNGKTSDVAAMVQQAHDQVLFLASLINDLSSLSRAEQGILELNVAPLNIHQLLQDLADSYRPSAAKKGLKLHLELDPSLELLQSSSLYIREILQNFITNAIKYTEKGSVTIQAKTSKNGVQVTVTDTGIGIGKGDQEQIYNKFFRSEDYRTRKHNGTGLGLYVTQKLARMVHAQISLESELDKGSSFTIVFPNLDVVPKQ